MPNMIEVTCPDIGDFKDVPVIELLVAEGDTVEKEQPLLVLESDKATMEVPAPDAGVVRNIKVKVGDRIGQGATICQLEAASTAAPAPAAKAAKAAPAPQAQPAPAPAAAPAPAVPAAAAAPAGDVTVTIPDIGDFTGIPVIEVLVGNGDQVEKEQPILVLESDKATMEVPAPAAGTISGFKLKVGDKVSKGDTVCTLTGVAGAAPAPVPAATPAAAASATAPAPVAAPAASAPVETPMQASGKPGELPHAGPATRKFARELGVDLAKVRGTGAKDRITIEDVQSFVKTSLKTAAAPAPAAAAAPSGGAGIPPIPAVDFSRFGAIESKPLARIRKISAQFLHRSWLNIPHVTQTDEADITDLEAFRKLVSDESAKGGGPKMTLLPFVMKAVEKALREYPEFCSSLAPDGESLIMKKYVHIGFAADTPNGLVVPVVRDVDQKSITQLAAETAELAKKARDGKLKPDEMQGGCFSISSLGGIGGSHFTPIVNAPEVGILGVSRSVMKPVWDGKAFQPRLMVPLSLSYDHRVIDGAYAARFTVYLVKLLSDARRLAL